MADNSPTKVAKEGRSDKPEEKANVNEVANADLELEQRRMGNLHGDNTSSSGGANNPGMHGRDGGEAGGTTNNPAPSDAAQNPEPEEEADEDAERKAPKTL